MKFTRLSPLRILLPVCWFAVAGCFSGETGDGVLLNDVHSRLNATRVAEYIEPESVEAVIELVSRAQRTGYAISISGGRHAMGGQQFGTDTLHVNLSKLDDVLDFDPARGLITVEAGIQWPALIEWLIENQREAANQWGIRQKQTGADNFSLGGSVSANVHGRGLTMKPIIDDVESIRLVDANGELLLCDRATNPELFGLAIGGYGLFGVITEVTLRLSPRMPIVREVEVIKLDDLPRMVEERVQDGFLYGDFQFLTDEKASDFLHKGVFSSYRVAAQTETESREQKKLSPDAWVQLYELAHTDKQKAFEAYSQYYLSTDGQRYWSDTHQLSTYVEGVDDKIDQLLGSTAPGSLMICEYYVPMPLLSEFMDRAAAAIHKTNANLIYGTVRFIKEDSESFLAWANQDFACTVMNLRVTHDQKGIEEAQTQFRALANVALGLGGSFFLTYHRWATKEQVLKAYPQFLAFLEKKRRHDPEELFQSDWYRHYRAMFQKKPVEIGLVLLSRRSEGSSFD